MTDSIVLAGSMLVDNVKMIPRWPDKGMLVQVSSVKRAIGGAVCNSGVDLKTLDPSLSVRALGKVGCDDAGDFVVAELEKHGLDCSLVSRTDAAPTTFTDVMTVEGTGERTFFNMHGADSALVPDDVDVSSLDCGIFHFGYLLLLDGMDAPDDEYGTKAARLLAKVQSAGIRTSIDIVSEQSGRFVKVVRPALKYCDYVVINEIEGSLASGVPADDMRGICKGLFDLGVSERVVVHRPECGVTMGHDGDYVEVPSLSLPSGWIKGSVGAGDAFCAGILYSLMKDLDPEYALRVASCAAAMNLASPDSTGGARSLSETMELESRFGRRAK